MASNQVSNQRHSGNSGQAPKSGQPSSGAQPRPRGAQSPSSQSSPSGVTEEVPGHDRSTLENVREQAADCWTRGEDQMRELVRDREGTAVMIALAAGLGLGLVLGSALAPAPPPRSWRERMMAEGFGRRIMDRIEGLIPDALAEHFSK